MIAAGLLAKKAVEAGLETKPWVKTSLAPGSRVVTDYLDRAGLTPYLEQLGFNLVGYGCTTCIGNSGPLPEAIAQAVDDGNLAVVAVLSGNRNFEGRIHSQVKASYLASPPAVCRLCPGRDGPAGPVARPDRLGRNRRRRLPGGDLARTARDRVPDVEIDVHRPVRGRVRHDLRRRRELALHAGARGRRLRVGTRIDLHQGAAVLRGPDVRVHAAGRHSRRPGSGGSGGLDNHRPHLPRRVDLAELTGRQVPAEQRGRPRGLQQLRLPPGQPRSHVAGHVRQLPAAQPAGAGDGGPVHSSTCPMARR